jgi:hypothetical protein
MRNNEPRDKGLIDPLIQLKKRAGTNDSTNAAAFGSVPN